MTASVPIVDAESSKNPARSRLDHIEPVVSDDVATHHLAVSVRMSPQFTTQCRIDCDEDTGPDI